MEWFRFSISLGLACFVITACNKNASPPTDSEFQFDVSGGYQLRQFGSQPELESYVRQSFKETHYQGVIEPVNFGILETTTADAALSTSASSGLSQTNVQVAGVDEADRIKSDGEILYVARTAADLSYGLVQIATPLSIATQPISDAPGIDIYDLSNTNNPLIATWQGDTFADSIYLDQPHQQLVLMPGNRNQYGWFDYFSWNHASSKIEALDVSNPAQPHSNWSLEFDGALISSRMLNGKLYLVTRYSPSLAEDYETPVLPYWRDSQSTELYAKAQQCFYPDQDPKQVRSDLIGIHVIELERTQPVVHSLCYVGGTETLFMSLENLYLATTQTHYELISDETGESVQYQPQTKTDIHRFALGQDTLVYSGSARIDGHLGWKQDQKSFRFGENNGVLGVVTSTGISWNPATEEDVSRFYTLAVGKQGFGIVNQIPNAARPEKIGKADERVYGVRFVGDRAHVVTFRTIDPLYVIDWSNPADPFIAGSLEIPGFSDYLQPLGDNLLLGIGKSVELVSGWGDRQFAVADSIKLSLFDVSNPQHPFEINSLELGHRGSEAGVLLDYHALAQLYLSASDEYLLALPLQIYDTEVTTAYGKYYRWTHSGQYRFNINDSGITLLDKVITEQSEHEYDYPQHTIGNARSLISADSSWYLQGNELIHTQH